MQTEGKMQTADQGYNADCILYKYIQCIVLFPLSSANRKQTYLG